MINFTPDELELARIHQANAAAYNPEWFNLFPSIFQIFTALMVLLGICVIGKFFWMLVYEIRFGLGDEYITGKLTKQEKEWLKEKYPLFWKAFYNQHIKWRFEKWLRK
jgi:hypothetical protein